MFSTSKFTQPWPEEKASRLGRLFISWTWPLFHRGCRKELEYEDVYRCSKEDDCQVAANALNRAWKDELKRKKWPSLFRAILTTFGPKYLFLILVIGGYEELIIAIVQPFFMGVILDYFSGNMENQELAYLSMLGFCTCSLIFVTSHHSYYVKLLRLSSAVRVAVQKLIMSKILVVAKTSFRGETSGQIINLVSNDVSKFEPLSVLITDLIMAPFQAVIISLILWKLLGISYLVGVALIVVFGVAQCFIGRKFGLVRQSTAEFTDKRIRLMKEIISGIKVIKMYSWEQPFAESVAKIRREEIKRVRKACFLKAINLVLGFVTTRVMLFLCIVVYLWTGHLLSARTVFLTMSLLNVLKGTCMTWAPIALGYLSEVMVSCTRIQNFLLLDQVCHLHDGEKPFITTPEQAKIDVKNLTAFWDARHKLPCLKKISFGLEPGELLIVVGPVGSGKTCLLLSMLREVHVVSERINIRGSISYASQEAWLFNASIRENVLFGKPMEKKKYLEILAATGLDQDIKLLDYGDMSLVGENGVNLSGGQRARVSLARAIYHEADIYLLDDPLSAVDTKVAKRIFEKCVKSYLKSKMVLLVTHQLHFLRESDKILVLNNGCGQLFDGFSHLQASGASLESIICVEKEVKTTKLDVVPEEASRSISRKGSTVSRISCKSQYESELEMERLTDSDEQNQTGSVTWRTYYSYFSAGAGPYLALFVLMLSFLSQWTFSGNDYWLAKWTDTIIDVRQHRVSATENMTSIPSSPLLEESFQSENGLYIVIYSLLVGGLFFTTLVRSIAFLYLCNRASVNLHNSIFYRLLRSPMQHFQENPIGRILNRFSRDLGIIDENLPLTALDQLMNIFSLLGVLVVVSIVTWYMIFPSLLLLVIIVGFRQIYIPAARAIKRIEATARSPIYSHLTTTMDGLVSIRAFKAESMFENAFTNYVNDHTATWLLFAYMSRAFAIWIDWVTLGYILTTSIVMSCFPGLVSAGSAGLALSQILTLTNNFTWVVRQSAEFESNMTSVERVLEYAKMDCEAELDVDVKPPSNWPSRGEIKLQNVNLRYPSAVKASLRDVNIEIKSGEKVGIVGRTGAGKSSLLYCLFRLVDSDGLVLIDGLDIKSIAAKHLRRKISIIPQDPVIFGGSVRFNLDPFQEHKDSQIWQVLKDVQLSETILQTNRGLEYQIQDNGENFSVGQKQLICLARALLRNNQILVIDEATANVDIKTDQLIQQTIRTKFSHCTVLTIAHRLNTVIDSDRILVLDSGRVVEFERPDVLLKDKNSVFYNLVAQTGKSMSQKLMEKADEQRRKLSPPV